MKKAILISIKPKYVAKILNKEKIVEIRKSIPKIDLPCKVYIYCTQIKDHKHYSDEVDIPLETGRWLGNGQIVAEFTLNKIDKIEICDPYIFRNNEEEDWKYFEKNACLTSNQMMEYIGYGEDHDGWDKEYDVGYAWHIDNLIIYDKPKELSEFKVYDKTYDHIGAFGWAFSEEEKYYSLKRPPQSWCYVEELS